jgi:hypothetical protein
MVPFMSYVTLKGLFFPVTGHKICRASFCIEFQKVEASRHVLEKSERRRGKNWGSFPGMRRNSGDAKTKRERTYQKLQYDIQLIYEEMHEEYTSELTGKRQVMKLLIILSTHLDLSSGILGNARGRADVRT